MQITLKSAETLGLQALSWLIGNEDLLPVFLGSTGADAETVKAQAGEPEFLGSVLDFLLMDDRWVQRVCDDLGLAYDRLMLARAALPGGAQVHWT